MSVHLASAIECPVANAEAPQRLVCFPHAGGSASFFRDWGRHLPSVEVYAVCYPGRARRLAEPPPTNLRELAAEIADAICPLADRPLALFGHSMGAPIALETARLLETRGVHVTHLFASGSRDAECVPSSPPLEEDPQKMVAQLVALGGTDRELAADPDFQALVLPYVLADGLMFNEYAMAPGPLLHCMVSTIVGDADPDADRRPWSRLTASEFRENVVPGDHFYLMPAPPYALIEDVLSHTTAPSLSLTYMEHQEEGA